MKQARHSVFFSYQPPSPQSGPKIVFRKRPMRREEELTAFKHRIDLRRYAAGQGYVPDRSKRWGNCEVMRQGSEKIVISMGESGVWMYWNATDQKDAGNIINFVQNRRSFNLGQVRRELRPWLDGEAAVPGGGGDFGPSLLPITRDKAEMHVSFAAMRPVTRSGYLSGVRGLPEAIIASQRFSGRIYEDHRSNAVFPHYDLEGICGYEIKNRDFTGFAPGGSKGLWCSRTTGPDNTLVIGEAAIDVLSFAALHPGESTRYVSTGGALGPAQPDLLKRAAAKMPTGSRIILAMDHDAAGKALAREIETLILPVAATGCVVSVRVPGQAGKDWNDVLRASQKS